MKKSNKKKTCPFLDTACLKEECQIYHHDFDKCYIELLSYNLYVLMVELKKLLERDK